MAAISVTPEQLRASAKVYIHASQEIQQQMQRVQNENNTMANEWRGQAFQAYLQQFEQLKGNVNQMTQLLEQINQQLETYANTVEQRDNEDRNAFWFALVLKGPQFYKLGPFFGKKKEEVNDTHEKIHN